MISAEVPIIFAKACEIFVLELTLRSWMQTEENKRRTLQKNDVSAAIGKTDTFDFLIDIVPREETSKGIKRLDWHNDYRIADPYFYAQYQQYNDAAHNLGKSASNGEAGALIEASNAPFTVYNGETQYGETSFDTQTNGVVDGPSSEAVQHDSNTNGNTVESIQNEQDLNEKE